MRRTQIRQSFDFSCVLARSLGHLPHEAAWAHVVSKTALAPPSPEAGRHLSCKSVGESGEVVRSGGISECLRTDGKGKIIDTQYRLISRAHAVRDAIGMTMLELSPNVGDGRDQAAAV
jgi:hypothetical protein